MYLLISLYLTFFGSCCGETNDNLTDVIEVSSSIATLPSFMTSPFTKLIHSTASSVKPLGTTEPLSTATPTTKESVKTTKEYATEYPTTSQKVTTQEYVNTKSTLKSSKTPKLSNPNSTSHSITQLQDRLGAIDCDLPVLPRESRLWRGNETHELNLPVTVSYKLNIRIKLFSHRKL